MEQEVKSEEKDLPQEDHENDSTVFLAKEILKIKDQLEKEIKDSSAALMESFKKTIEENHQQVMSEIKNMIESALNDN